MPALKTMARTSGNQLARIHALWTLEGLGSLDAPLARELMKSPDPPRAHPGASARARRSTRPATNRSPPTTSAMTKDADPNVVIQAMLTMNLHNVPDARGARFASTVDASSVRGIKEIGHAAPQAPAARRGSGRRSRDTGAGGVNLTVDRAPRARSAARHLQGAVLLVPRRRRQGRADAGRAGGHDAGAVAGGITARARASRLRDQGAAARPHRRPIEGKAYGTAVMVPMGSNTDQWIADVASYVRNCFGNGAPFVTPEQVTAVRKAVKRGQPWTMAELMPTIPTPLTNAAEWKVTASHNRRGAGNVPRRRPPRAGTRRAAGSRACGSRSSCRCPRGSASW